MAFYVKFLFAIITSFRLIPHIIFWFLSKNKDVITLEVKDTWERYELNIIYDIKYNINPFFKWVYLMTHFKCFRNLFYYRIGNIHYIFSFLCQKEKTLFLDSKAIIGERLFLQHSFSTILNPERMGKGCMIYQQVTIGATNEGRPIIGDNVSIYAGAIIIGRIKIGNDVIIGANSLVNKDVPDNCTVVGVPAFIVKKDGIRIDKDA